MPPGNTEKTHRLPLSAATAELVRDYGAFSRRERNQLRNEIASRWGRGQAPDEAMKICATADVRHFIQFRDLIRSKDGSLPSVNSEDQALFSRWYKMGFISPNQKQSLLSRGVSNSAFEPPANYYEMKKNPNIWGFNPGKYTETEINNKWVSFQDLWKQGKMTDKEMLFLTECRGVPISLFTSDSSIEERANSQRKAQAFEAYKKHIAKHKTVVEDKPKKIIPEPKENPFGLMRLLFEREKFNLSRSFIGLGTLCVLFIFNSTSANAPTFAAGVNSPSLEPHKNKIVLAEGMASAKISPEKTAPRNLNEFDNWKKAGLSQQDINQLAHLYKQVYKTNLSEEEIADLAFTISQRESRTGNPKFMNENGLMGVMPATAQGWQKKFEARLSPEQQEEWQEYSQGKKLDATTLKNDNRMNLAAGIGYLCQTAEYVDAWANNLPKDLRKAIALDSYNAGPNRVQGWVKSWQASNSSDKISPQGFVDHMRQEMPNSKDKFAISIAIKYLVDSGLAK